VHAAYATRLCLRVGAAIERCVLPRQKKEIMGRLIVQCLKRCEPIDMGIATDYKSLSKSWEKTLHIACPHCSEEHEVKVRDAFIRAAVSDIVVHGIPQL
jgi:hypothetical protein